MKKKPSGLEQRKNIELLRGYAVYSIAKIQIKIDATIAKTDVLNEVSN